MPRIGGTAFQAVNREGHGQDARATNRWHGLPSRERITGRRSVPPGDSTGRISAIPPRTMPMTRLGIISAALICGPVMTAAIAQPPAPVRPAEKVETLSVA